MNYVEAGTIEGETKSKRVFNNNGKHVFQLAGHTCPFDAGFHSGKVPIRLSGESIMIRH